MIRHLSEAIASKNKKTSVGGSASVIDCSFNKLVEILMGKEDIGMELLPSPSAYELEDLLYTNQFSEAVRYIQNQHLGTDLYWYSKGSHFVFIANMGSHLFTGQIYKIQYDRYGGSIEEIAKYILPRSGGTDNPVRSGKSKTIEKQLVEEIDELLEV